MTKLALVTGGTRGIGRAIAIALQESGHVVVTNYGKNDIVAEEFLKETGIKIYKWDVANHEECINNVRKIEDKFGMAVSVLVNNAGITRDGMFHKMSFDAWDEVLRTNLYSCFNMCQAVISGMRDQNYGRIINISSINALSGQVGQVNYAAAKSGMLGLTKSMARENAMKGVTVNAVCPGYVKTEMTDVISPGVLEAIISQIPIKRLGLPEEIARVVAFLADKSSGLITGETVSINGGLRM